LQESETWVHCEARVHALVEEVAHIGLHYQYEMHATKNFIKVRKESGMGRALGLWLLGVPVFVIILLYFFHVI